MSPRAAWRLESLGFKHVYDYIAGKNDWTARRLPIEGHLSHVLKAGDVMTGDVATCGPADTVEDVRIQASSEHGCIVVNDQRIVLGRITPRALQNGGGTNVEMLMEPGPTTVRPDEELEALLERMRAHNVSSIVVTDPDGRLMGMVGRERAEALLDATDHSSHQG